MQDSDIITIIMEIWSKIKGYENYLVSNYGNVKNLKFDRLLKPVDLNGYLRVPLSNSNGTKTFLIHRLVAEAFCPNEFGHKIVHHIDCNKSNNVYTNLMWCSQSYNIKRAYDDGLVPLKFGTDNPNYKNGKYTKIKTMKTYIIFGLKDPRTDEIKFIDQTCNMKSRYNKIIFIDKPEWIEQLKHSGYKPEIVQLETIETDNIIKAKNLVQKYREQYNLK